MPVSRSDLHSLEWWICVGLLPAIIYVPIVLLSYSDVGWPSAVAFGLGVYCTLMPAFALAWLVVLTLDHRLIEFDDGPSMTCGGYILLCFGINTAVWLFFVVAYLGELSPH